MSTEIIMVNHSHSVDTVGIGHLRRLSKRKIKEVLRLRFELGLGQREIARARSLSQGAVHNYLKTAAETGMQWPLPEGWGEMRIEEAVFGKQCSIEESSRRAFPDFPALHQQLKQHPHLTLQLAWYREKKPEEYRSSGESALSVLIQDLRITE